MKYCIRTITLLISLIIIGCKGIEVQYGKSSLDPHPVDSDGDMLTDFEEKVFTGTDGHNADTDGDDGEQNGNDQRPDRDVSVGQSKRGGIHCGRRDGDLFKASVTHPTEGGKEE